MNEREQVQRFANELDALVNRYRDEYDLSYAAAVGALHFKIHNLCVEAQSRADEDELPR